MDELITRLRRRADDPLTRTDNSAIALPPRFPAVTEKEIAKAQHRLGFCLPPFLADVYMNVGNGGFGPGYGLIGLPGGYTDDGKSVIELYASYHITSPHEPEWLWPEALVPVCHWGCAIYSCVDCHSGAVVTFAPDSRRQGEPMSLDFAPSHPSVAAWLEDWVSDVRLWDRMFEEDPSGNKTMIANPFTGQSTAIPKRRLRR